MAIILLIGVAWLASAVVFWGYAFASTYDPMPSHCAQDSPPAGMERRRIPTDVDFHTLGGGVLRTEARQSLSRFRPATFGQAGRLEGVTPADLTLLAVLLGRPRADSHA